MAQQTDTIRALTSKPSTSPKSNTVLQQIYPSKDGPQLPSRETREITTVALSYGILPCFLHPIVYR